MTEQYVLTNSTTENKQSCLYLNLDLFGPLGDLNRINRNAVSVMRSLISCVGGNVAVQTMQAAMAQQCRINLQEVAKAIADLARTEKPDDACPLPLVGGV